MKDNEDKKEYINYRKEFKHTNKTAAAQMAVYQKRIDG